MLGLLLSASIALLPIGDWQRVILLARILTICHSDVLDPELPGLLELRAILRLSV